MKDWATTSKRLECVREPTSITTLKKISFQEYLEEVLTSTISIVVVGKDYSTLPKAHS